MKISELLEAEYPFGVAVPLRRPEDSKMAADLFQLTASMYGASAPAPEVLVVDHEKMQWAAQHASHHTTIQGQIFGWYSMKFPDKVFLSSQLPLARSRFGQATLVHEYTHYLQDNATRDPEQQPYTPGDVNALEQEADEIMNRFLKGAR
jgi:hypothetical protein